MPFIIEHNSSPATKAFMEIVKKIENFLKNAKRLERTPRVSSQARARIEVAGKISFDPIVTEAMVAGKTIVEHSPENKVSQEIKTVWKRVFSVLKN